MRKLLSECSIRFLAKKIEPRNPTNAKQFILIYTSLTSTKSLSLFGLHIKMLQLNTVQTCTPLR